MYIIFRNYETFIFLQTKGKEDDESGDEEETEKNSSLPKGCVIHFSDVPDECTREDIKERLGELDASVAFVDFKIGDEEGWVRLQGENTAKTVFDKMKGGKVSIQLYFLLSFISLSISQINNVEGINSGKRSCLPYSRGRRRTEISCEGERRYGKYQAKV